MQVHDIPDIEQFCESLRIGLDHFTFDGREFLHDIIHDTSQHIVITKSRQVGFTVLQSAMMAHAALSTPGIGIMYCSYSLKHMRYISKSLLRPFLNTYASLKKSEESIESYHLNNGSIITLISGTGAFRQAVGYKIDLMMIDEAERLPLEDLPVILEGMAASKVGRVIMGGTGGMMGSEWENEWMGTDGKEWRDNTWQPTRQGTSGYHITQRMMPYWTQEKEDAKRVKYSEQDFKTEVLGEFAAQTASALTLQDVRQQYHGTAWHQPQQRTGKIIAGIDLAGGGQADTVISIAEMIDGVIHLRYAHNMHGTLTQDYPRINEILRDWSPDVIACDAGGNDALLHEISSHWEIMKCRMGKSKEPIIYGKDEYPISKTFFIQRHIERYHQNTITLPDVEEWVEKQLTADTAETIQERQGGSYIRYTKLPDRKDDMLMAMAFCEAAIYSMSDPNNPANHTTRIV